MSLSKLELLAPAKNAAFGIEAINHGADAVYIGGPAFGARSAAANSVSDIGKLAEHAHRYGAQVFVALNTLLHDHELERARTLIWECYEAGVDALIVQDLGLLTLDLPPIALHASTQLDNRTPEKVQFLEAVGFSQVVLARELDLTEIRAIRAATTVQLEYFIHGALCVSYSGQCNISYAQCGRSANRGECAQLCRLPGTLSYPDGREIARNQHLLSLKDLDQSAHIEALIDAGINSFKIEGRLKDLDYVKNVTAWYRQKLDAILARRSDLAPASQGRCHFNFTPQPQKSFNRGQTNYFLFGRQGAIHNPLTPKSLGEPIGKVKRLQGVNLELERPIALNNGDGLCYLNANGELEGVRLNSVQGETLQLAQVMPKLRVGSELYRNYDHQFMRQLERASSERRIEIEMTLAETDDGFTLTLRDPSGVSASAHLATEIVPADNLERATTQTRAQLTKLGNTLFSAIDVQLNWHAPAFIPASSLNQLRREAVANLEAARTKAYQRPEVRPRDPEARYPKRRLNYLSNALNQAAVQFLQQHGVERLAPAFEKGEELGIVPLMITKHCLRHSYQLCPKEYPELRADPLKLTLGHEEYELRFDCARCEMQVCGQKKRK